MESSSFLKASRWCKHCIKHKFDEAVTLFQQEMQRNYQAEYEGGI